MVLSTSLSPPLRLTLSMMHLLVVIVALFAACEKTFAQRSFEVISPSRRPKPAKQSADLAALGRAKASSVKLNGTGVTRGNSGVLLLLRDGEGGTRIEYRDPTLSRVDHSASFPLCHRSFAVEHGESSTLVVANQEAGTVSRLHKWGGGEADVTSRHKPHAITYVETGEQKVMFWLEEENKESFFSLSAYNPLTKQFGKSERATLAKGGCKNASHSGMLKFFEKKRLVFLVVCGDDLFGVEIELPLPDMTSPNHTIKAKSYKLRFAGGEMFTGYKNIRAIATDHSTRNDKSKESSHKNYVFVAYGDGVRECGIYRLIIALEETEGNSFKPVVFGLPKRVLDCSMEADVISIRGLAYSKDVLYISTYTPGALSSKSAAISALSLDRHSDSDGSITTSSSLEVVVSRASTSMPVPGLFSPGFIHIKETEDDDVYLYWSDLTSGKISHIVGRGRGAFRGVVHTESASGCSVPTDMTLKEGATENKTLAYWTDYSTNSIYQLDLSRKTSWSTPTSFSGLVMSTGGPPSSIVYEPTLDSLFYVEPTRGKIFQHSLTTHSMIAEFEDQDHYYEDETIYHDIAYSAATKRLYATVPSPHNSRIVSWNVRDPEEGCHVEWVSGTVSFVPKLLLADPKIPILYTSDFFNPVIYAIYLSPPLNMKSDLIVSPASANRLGGEAKDNKIERISAGKGRHNSTKKGKKGSSVGVEDHRKSLEAIRRSRLRSLNKFDDEWFERAKVERAMASTSSKRSGGDAISDIHGGDDNPNDHIEDDSVQTSTKKSKSDKAKRKENDHNSATTKFAKTTVTSRTTSASIAPALESHPTPELEENIDEDIPQGGLPSWLMKRKSVLRGGRQTHGHTAVRVFYESPGDVSASIQSLRMHNGLVHWTEVAPAIDQRLRFNSSLRYKPRILLHQRGDEPALSVDMSLLYKQEVKPLYIAKAAFYKISEDVHFHARPAEPSSVVGGVTETATIVGAGALGIMMVVAVGLCYSRTQTKGDESEHQRLTERRLSMDNAVMPEAPLVLGRRRP